MFYSYLYSSLTFTFQQTPSPCFLRKWGSKGAAPGQFSNPSCLTVHPHLDLVFVMDSWNHRIQSFHSNGTAVKQWGSYGKNDGEFRYASSIAILAQSQDQILARSQDQVLAQPQDQVLAQPQNRVLARSQDRGHPTQDCIFVTDCVNHRIQVFDVDGSFIQKWGSYGQADGQFSYPRGVAILARSQDRGHPTQSLVYVTDCQNHRVQVFGTDGTFVRKWGTQGSNDSQFDDPVGVSVHPTRDLIFICEVINNRIQAFRSDGTFLYKWGSAGSDDGQFFYPGHISLHPTRDLLFVADCCNSRVQVFDLDGSFVCKWESFSKFADGPSGISVHPNKDLVYVSSDNHIQAFSLFPTKRKCKKVADVYVPRDSSES